ncbi:MAG: hypothetical protein AAFN30_08185, partial [Actinomycetota bacterium]
LSIPYLLAPLAGALGGAAFGAIIAAPSLRLPGAYLARSTTRVEPQNQTSSTPATRVAQNPTRHGVDQPGAAGGTVAFVVAVTPGSRSSGRSRRCRRAWPPAP